MAFYKVPGVSVAVISNWSIDWAHGYGVKEIGTNEAVTTDTLFQAASISKPVTALAALRLVQDGRLSLDDDVNKTLVSWKLPDSEFARDEKVTLRRLLSHSSGITNSSVGTYTPDQTVPGLLEILGGTAQSKTPALQVSFVPGSRWQYSGGGYSVLQQLLMDTSGEAFSELMQKIVLIPIGMNHSFFQQPLSRDLSGFAASGHDRDGEMLAGRWRVFPEMAAAGLWTTPSDLALFEIEIETSALGRSHKVLSTDMTRQMLTRQAGHWGLGLDLGIEGEASSFNHSGWNDGYRSFLIAFSQTGQGAVVMTNGDSDGGRFVLEIIRSIADEYEWPLYGTREHVLTVMDEKTSKEYVGEYQFAPSVNFMVTLDGGRLFILAPPLGSQPVELYHEAGAEFFVTVDNVTFTFVRDEHGLVTEMIVRPPDQTVRAKKVR
ncbi:MAG: serine hydrolase [Acidobacteria bacterium]|nr:serine hydrolase [Acidobacteriota bacterium]